MGIEYTKKKLVYISHPSGGLIENDEEIANIVRELYKNDDIYNNFCIVSPVHCYGFMYNEYDSSEKDYYKGLSFCTDLLLHCDLMLLTGNWETSRGCNVEVGICKEAGIPLVEIKTLHEIKEKLQNGNLAKELLDKIK